MDFTGPSLAAFCKPISISLISPGKSQRRVFLLLIAPFEKRWTSVILNLPERSEPRITRPDSAPKSMAR